MHKIKVTIISFILLFILIIVMGCSSSPSPFQEPSPTEVSPSIMAKVSTQKEPSPQATIHPTFTTFPSTLTPIETLGINPLSPTVADMPRLVGRIAFVDFMTTLETIDPYGNNETVIVDKAPTTEPEKWQFSYYMPAWSPDGRWIAFTSDFSGYGNQLYIVKADGSSLKQMTFFGPDNLGADIAWSPDGKKIAYQTSSFISNHYRYYLYLMNTDGTGVVQLTNSELPINSPAWSPDGERIAYLSVQDGPPLTVSLNVMRSDGSGSKTIVDQVEIYSRIFWTPDGNRISYISPDCRLYTVDPDGNHAQALTDQNTIVTESTWSPDGKWVALVVSPGCTSSGIGETPYLLNLTNGKMILLPTRDKHYASNLSWSPVPSLQVDRSYTISAWGDNLQLRTGISTQEKVIKTLKQGDTITVLDGPIENEGFYWWKLKTSDGTVGWAVDVAGWYKPINSG